MTHLRINLKTIYVNLGSGLFTERPEVLPMLQFGKDDAGIAREPVMYLANTELTQLCPAQRPIVISDVTR